MLRRGAVVLLVGLSLGACQSDPGADDLSIRVPNPTPRSTKTRIVGLVGSMTGADSWRGDDAFEGADLAVHVLNRSLHGNEPMYELVTLDDQGDPAQATEFVKRLAESDRTIGIVYAGPPEGLPPAEKFLARGGVPAVICYGDLYGARLLSPHIFQTSPSFLWEGRRIADYLLADRDYQRVGLISGKNLTGETARRTLTLALQEEGATLTASATYPADLEDAVPLVAELRRKKVQAVVVEASPPSTLKILKAFKQAGARYKTTAIARAAASGGRWAPQIVGLDLAISPVVADAGPPRGTVGADSYARGVHYLPIPNFERFRTDFEDWWGAEPLGWERRSYDAVSMIGWATRRAAAEARVAGTDLAPFLEKIVGLRFSGLDVTLGPDDHTAVDQSTVGLWVVPRPGSKVRESDELPNSMPWVPLARGFSIDGERTDVLPRDWKWLFRNAPPPKAPAPRLGRSKFGVTTTSQDRVH